MNAFCSMRQFSGPALRSARTLLLLLISVVSCAVPGRAQLEFYQLSWDLNGTMTQNSDWGGLEITISGAPPAGFVFLNLSIAGNGVSDPWQIKNVPLYSLVSSPDSPQTHYFTFQIGQNGQHVDAIAYGFSLTPDTMSGPPQIFGTSPVQPFQVVMHSDVDTTAPDSVRPGVAGPINGNTTNDTTNHVNRDFPNQEAGVNECVPVAISNSLQWLNARDHLGLSSGATSIDSIKPACGWTPSGAPLEWWRIKDNYMKTHGYPITTTRYSAPFDLDVISAQIDDGQDIELTLCYTDASGNSFYHEVNVVGIKKLKNGTYDVVISHDARQGQAGGTVREHVIYDPTVGRFTCGTAKFFTTIYNFVVECPKSTGVGPDGNARPQGFRLFDNYPNPFNPSTTIRYSVAEAGHVVLTIHDVLGREVTTLVNAMQQPGTYSVRWNAGGYASGVYYYRLQTREFVQTKSLLLVK